MSLFLPLLLAGALAASSAPNVTPDDKTLRKSRVLIDTVAHRRIATDLALRARHDAENGNLDAARAQLLTANTMLRESGGLQEATVYSLVHVDYALLRYTEAADLLSEFADQAMKAGNVAQAATAVADAAELYNMDNRRVLVANTVARLRELIADPLLPDADRAALRKRLG